MAKTMIKHRKTYFSKGKIAVIAAIAAMMAPLFLSISDPQPFVRNVQTTGADS